MNNLEHLISKVQNIHKYLYIFSKVKHGSMCADRMDSASKTKMKVKQFVYELIELIPLIIVSSFFRRRNSGGNSSSIIIIWEEAVEPPRCKGDVGKTGSKSSKGFLGKI